MGESSISMLLPTLVLFLVYAVTGMTRIEANNEQSAIAKRCGRYRIGFSHRWYAPEKLERKTRDELIVSGKQNMNEETHRTGLVTFVLYMGQMNIFINQLAMAPLITENLHELYLELNGPIA